MKSSLPKRRLIPKWRPIARTLESPEVIPAGKPTSSIAPTGSDRHQFELARRDWEAEGTQGHFGDLLAFSIHPEFSSEVVSIARGAMERGFEPTGTQARLIKALANDEPLDERVVDSAVQFRTRTRELRQLLRVAPNNPLALVDFAQLQLATGKQRSAERALDSAAQLLPHSKVVARTKARFLVHTGDFEAALAVIRRHPKVQQDPWLMASEIALSDLAGRPSESIRRGRRVLLDKTEHPRQLSELAGAIASADLAVGQLKSARAMLRLALRAPTDNVVAQALTEQRASGVVVDSPAANQLVLDSSEASLFSAWTKGAVQQAEAFARSWHNEEPFSSRPIQFIASLHSFRREYEDASRWLRSGLLADPNDSGLAVTLAYTLAASGKLNASEKLVGQLRRHSDIAPFLLATEGLIALRRSHFEMANRLYRAAMEDFRKSGRLDLEALCIAHYAKSAAELDLPFARALQSEAVELELKAPTQDSKLVLASVGTILDTSGKDEVAALRRTGQWQFDPVNNSLTRVERLTSPGAPPVIFVPKKN